MYALQGSPLRDLLDQPSRGGGQTHLSLLHLPHRDVLHDPQVLLHDLQRCSAWPTDIASCPLVFMTPQVRYCIMTTEMFFMTHKTPLSDPLRCFYDLQALALHHNPQKGSSGTTGAAKWSAEMFFMICRHCSHDPQSRSSWPQAVLGIQIRSILDGRFQIWIRWHCHHFVITEYRYHSFWPTGTAAWSIEMFLMIQRWDTVLFMIHRYILHDPQVRCSFMINREVVNGPAGLGL